MDLPEIPNDEIYRLEAMATNADQLSLMDASCSWGCVT